MCATSVMLRNAIETRVTLHCFVLPLELALLCSQFCSLNNMSDGEITSFHQGWLTTAPTPVEFV